MEPKIVQREALRLVGLVHTGRPQDIAPKIPEIWDQFTRKFEAKVSPYSTDKAYYGAWFGGPSETVAYLVGMAVSEMPAIPEGLAERMIPAARYAEFACTAGTFGPTSDFAYSQWLPSAPYEYDMSAAELEVYPPDTATEDAPTALCIPIKEKEAQKI